VLIQKSKDATSFYQEHDYAIKLKCGKQSSQSSQFFAPDQPLSLNHKWKCEIDQLIVQVYLLRKVYKSAGTNFTWQVQQVLDVDI